METERIASPSAVREEVRARVVERLPRFGVAGVLTLEEGTLRLESPSGTASASIDALLLAWNASSEDARNAQLDRIVRALVADLRGRGPGAPSSLAPGPRPDGGRRSFGWSVVAVGLAALVAVAAVVALRWGVADSSLRQDAAPAAHSAQGDPGAVERAARAAKACEAARGAVLRGAPLSVAQSQGWVAELVLLREAPGPALAHGDRFRPTLLPDGDGALALAEDDPLSDAIEFRGTIRLAMADASVVGAGERWRGVRLTYPPPLLQSLLTADGHRAHLALADRLARAAGASHGALVFRCAHLGPPRPRHDAAAWVLGPSAAGAGASLLYFIGAHLDRPTLPPDWLGEDGAAALGGAQLDRLVSATQQLDAMRLATLLGPANAHLATGPDGAQRVVFPPQAHGHAARAAALIAQAAGLAAP